MRLLTQIPPEEKLRIEQLMTIVHIEALRLLDDWIGVPSGPAPPHKADASGRQPLVSLFPVEGSVHGMIALSGEESAVRAIMHKLIGEPASDEDQEELLRETLVEILNIMVGNAMQSLRQQGLSIKMFPPYANAAGSGDSLFAESVYTRRIDTLAGSMVLTFSGDRA
jgi:CheY-specific phosphatase CheX